MLQPKISVSGTHKRGWIKEVRITAENVAR